MGIVYYGDNLSVLQKCASYHFDLIYLDPPFNSNKVQEKKTLEMITSAEGTRDGFAGNRYNVKELAKKQYNDSFADYAGFLFPRLEELYRVLKNSGSLFLHLDWREVHYVKVFMDSLFGRDNCLNEIIWSWDYGAKSKAYWPRKHNTILWYVKDLDNYFFDIEQSDRLPYMAPGLVTKEKAEKGKLPTDSWWGSIVGTNSHEKTEYPNQKPMWLLRRIIKCHTQEGDIVLDPFAGSGTTGAVCLELNRNFVLIDNNISAIETMDKRFDGKGGLFLADEG